MAQRRMFSLKIVDSDAFLDMPQTAQNLYFQLGMRADDDGFVNPRKIMRVVGASEDDLRILKAKRFVFEFGNGVVVIKHWLTNNYIRKDWYEPTKYLNERGTLFFNENGDYTDRNTGELQNVNKMLTQDRIGKDRLDNTKSKNFSKNTDAEKILRKQREAKEDEEARRMNEEDNISLQKINKDIKKLTREKTV